MRNKKTFIITCLIIASTALFGLFFWDRLPDPMATHFSLSGEPNGWSGKAFGVFGIPAILLAVQLLCVFATSKDPKTANISDKIYNLILWIVPLIAVLCQAMVIAMNLGHSPKLVNIAPAIVGVLFIAVGNYLPKCRQNFTAGIRIAWTLANEENWNKTHRLAGPIWMAEGVLMLITAATGIKALAIASMAGIAVIVLIPAAYSYWLHDRKGL